jgi:hypothetical protein
VNYRLIYVGLSLALVAVMALGVAFGSKSGEPVALPSVVDAVLPRPGETVPRQTRLEVDMSTGYTVEIFIDGLPIPTDELVIVEATGLYAWQPGPGRLFEEWNRGEHTVKIIWNTVVGLADAGEFSWTFRNF